MQLNEAQLAKLERCRNGCDRKDVITFISNGKFHIECTLCQWLISDVEENAAVHRWNETHKQNEQTPSKEAS